MTVWFDFTSSFIINPFFCKELYGDAFKTVFNPYERHESLLKTSHSLLAREASTPFNSIYAKWSSSAHSYSCRKQEIILRLAFGDKHVFGWCFSHEWPQRSPDLATSYFWLWDYLKWCVYRDRPTSLGQLKESVRQHVSGIPSECSTGCLLSSDGYNSQWRETHWITVIFKKHFYYWKWILLQFYKSSAIFWSKM